MQTLRSRHYVLRQACYDIGNGGLAVGDLPSNYQLQFNRGIKLFEVSALSNIGVYNVSCSDRSFADLQQRGAGRTQA